MRAISDSSMDNGSGPGFAVGLLCGAALGATVALLFAPKEGSALRRDVVNASDRLKRRAARLYDGAAEAVDDLSARGTQAIDELASRTSEAMDQGREVVQQMGARARSHAKMDRTDSV